MSEQPSPSTNHNNNITAVTSPQQQPHSPGMPLPMSIPSENRTSPAREQGGPPPPGRPDYSYGGYPPYSPYPPPYPYGYPGPPPPHYPSGYAPLPPPHYGYGAPSPYSAGRYPSQQPSNNKQAQQPPLNDSTKRRKSPVRKSPQKSSNKTSPTNSTPSNNNNNNNSVAEDIELERLRAAAEPMQVAPMRSDFHFFMDDQRDEVQKQVAAEYDGDDKYLLFSNMNARIMKLWEDATAETRAVYMTKEEEDRKRFMSEDEIASRHCATLTARAKSPRKEEQQQNEEGESPPKKVKVDGGNNNNSMHTDVDGVKV